VSVCVGAGMRLSSRARVSCAVVAMWVGFAVLGSHPAQAQSFFESLFGWGGGSKSAPPAVNAPPNQGRAGSGSIFTPGGYPYSVPASGRSSRGDDEDDDNSRGNSGTKFRTVCVRTCDGFYFPLSFAVTKKNFYADGQRCQAQCGEEGRLFYLPSPNGEIEQATDLSGRSYDRLPNAYKYRKTRVEGCGCRPAPWSDAEMARHRRYAEIEARDGVAVKPDAAQVAAKADTPADKATVSAAKSGSDDGDSKPVKTKSAERRRSPAPVVVARALLPAPPLPIAKSTPPALTNGSLGGAMALGGASKHRWPGD
jgi:Protein of unknown function (DUF2865)